MKAILRLLRSVVMMLNMAAALVMILSAYSSVSSSLPLQVFSLTTLAFKYILLLNLLFVAVWLLLKPRLALVPVAALLICAGPIWDFYPLHFSNSKSLTAAYDQIKIITYNTHSFGYKLNGDSTETDNPIGQFIDDSQADIVFLQESTPAQVEKLYNAGYLKSYPYRSGHTALALNVISKHPIVDQEPSVFVSGGNGFMNCRMVLNNDTISLYCCHLKSIGLVQEEIDDYHAFIESPSNQENYSGSKKVVKKLLTATIERDSQADSLAARIEHDASAHIIVAGDFNDTPLSYSFRKIKEYLQPAYSAGGRGMGVTYNQNSLNYRIDHIFCSQDFKVTGCRVAADITASDHNPLIAVIRYRP